MKFHKLPHFTRDVTGQHYRRLPSDVSLPRISKRRRRLKFRLPSNGLLIICKFKLFPRVMALQNYQEFAFVFFDVHSPNALFPVTFHVPRRALGANRTFRAGRALGSRTAWLPDSSWWSRPSWWSGTPPVSWGTGRAMEKKSFPRWIFQRILKVNEKKIIYFSCLVSCNKELNFITSLQAD